MASDGGDESTGEPHSVFQTRRLLQVIELPLENSDETNVILAFASRCAAKKQFQAFYCADKTLLLRSLEEDLHPRYWRLPWAMALERLQPTSKLPTTIDGSSTTPLQQQHHVVGLEFAPEGDWLAVIVSSGLRTFLLLVPVASLVTRERKVSLQMHLRDGTPEDLMSVAPSAMSTKMLSFLRPHGQNGAKYNSAVTGDSEDMSVLEFAQGMSSPTCVTWWRSFNGRNYVLLGSSSDLISIVHVETNVECCRCELSGKIVRMELVRTATTTTLLVETTKQHPDGATSWFFQVLLEMRKDHAMITTFPDHFLQDTASFRPVRIKHFGAAASVHVVHRATDDDDKEEDLLAVCDGRSVRLYSNDFTWSLLRTLTLPPSVLEADGNPPPPQVGKIALCSSQLFLVQVARKTHNVALWVSIQRRPRPTSPSSAVLSGDDDDDRGQDDVETQVVHTLKLREDEWVRHAQLGHASSKDQPSTIAYFVHTDHQVYECRPKWTSSTLFHALYTRTMHVQHAVFIGYALGLDMAALCESVADAICADHTNKKMSRNSCEWVMRLYAKSGHVMPSTTLQNLLQNGGVNAIEYAKEALALPSPSYKHDRQFVAHAVITSALKLHHRATCPATKDWAWFLWFLQSNADFDTVFAIARCVDFECVDAALLIGHARHHVDAALHALQHVGMTLSEAQVDTLLSQHHASNLTAPEARVLFRSLPLSVQLKVLLKHPSAIWAQRDWLVRVLPDATDAECVALASTLDPRTLDSVQFQSSDGGLLPYNNGVPASLSDVASSEAIPVTLEERVELFLTLLLRLNCTSLDTPPSKVPTAFSQQDLVQLLGGWSKQYRPPVMVFRCAEYGNWAAAAACYEAQGEWVDAIECKLHLHDIEPSSSLSYVLLVVLVVLVLVYVHYGGVLLVDTLVGLLRMV
ncbi:hypothetical protein, variant 2 [Aphanomyces astaci]|uniref:Uncharacterized protein n=1 Tax=Aphanomyces astaci TaxID=112090 RepID=W4FHK5_APHAT|nr:hypothetical protein, variant 2 [Aphanomyces astaci]ETV66339.1 hypothetical protein, variant 2 [Aphanomyces astaci]|eukprot:XP_009844114.1 hypothetical protein, variant 2 [Aphanomyces astaci]